MHAALTSWNRGGGREHFEPAISEMPFEDLLRGDDRDGEAIERIQRLHTRWQELQLAANALAEDKTAAKFARQAAQNAADAFYANHQGDFALLATLESADEVNDYDWQQRTMGARLVFRWILAEGFHPLKVMKRLYAVGRAMNVRPFTELTMEEQGKMFGETKAAVSWRMQLLSGLIKLRGMIGHRLPGQKSPDAKKSYHVAALGNSNRANGKANGKANGHAPKVRQASFLRTLHVPTTKPNS